MKKNSSIQGAITKANALLCPVCCVECVEVEFDFEVDGIVLHNVRALKCQICNEERFTPEQQATIIKRISDSVES